MLVAFGEELLLLWTGDAGLANRAAPLLALLAGGTLLNGLMHMPYMLQLAYGWTGFAVRINVVAVALLVPAIFWAVPHYGAMGAAWAWVLLNAGYVGIGVFFMHRRLLPAEKWRWYRQDVAIPLLLIAVYVLLARLWMPMGIGRLETLPWLAAICALGGLGLGWHLTPQLRHRL
jgi:O-antigen/teichoic acid export membrane protein